MASSTVATCALSRLRENTRHHIFLTGAGSQNIYISQCCMDVVLVEHAVGTARVENYTTWQFDCHKY